MSLNHYEVGCAIKNGIIDKKVALDFDLDEYYNSILNKESERDLEKKKITREQ